MYFDVVFSEVATFEKDGASIKEGSLTYAAVDIDSILDASAEGPFEWLGRTLEADLFC